MAGTLFPYLLTQGPTHSRAICWVASNPEMCSWAGTLVALVLASSKTRREERTVHQS